MAPIEHGAWGLFLIPLAVGAIVSRRNVVGQILLALSTLGVFLMRRPALHWLRAFSREPLDAIQTVWPGRAFILCFALTTACGLPLLWMGHLYLILVSVIAASLIWSEVYISSSRNRYPFLSELTEVWVLSLLAPSAYYVGTGRLDETAALLWILCVIYFSVSIADIRVRLARFRVIRQMADESLVHERKIERLITCWVAVAGALMVAFLTPAFRPALLALVPLVIRPFFRQNKPVSVATDIPSLGWSEVYFSLAFAGLAARLI